MNKDDEMTIELAKNKADEFILKKELEKGKKDFISIIETTFGKEINEVNFAEINKPVKYKKPFKLKIKDFFKKLNAVWS